MVKRHENFSVDWLLKHPIEKLSARRVVIVIDDDQSAALLLKRLSKQGFNIETFTSTADAIKRMAQLPKEHKKVSTVITDSTGIGIEPPKDFCARAAKGLIKGLDRETPIEIQSGLDPEAEIQMRADLPNHRTFLKPINLPETTVRLKADLIASILREDDMHIPADLLSQVMRHDASQADRAAMEKEEQEKIRQFKEKVDFAAIMSGPPKEPLTNFTRYIENEREYLDNLKQRDMWNKTRQNWENKLEDLKSKKGPQEPSLS